MKSFLRAVKNAFLFFKDDEPPEGHHHWRFHHRGYGNWWVCRRCSIVVRSLMMNELPPKCTDAGPYITAVEVMRS